MKDFSKYQKMKLTDNKIAFNFIKQFNLKRVVVGRGHDCGGVIADLCLRNKVLLEFNDDGWGGEPEIRFTTSDNERYLKNEFIKINFQKLVFENGYGFMENENEIRFETQIDCLINSLIEIKDNEKLMKKCEKCLIFGTQYKYNIVSYKNIKSLKDLPIDILQRTYDKYKATLKDNESFINTNKQLVSLGIKL